MIILKIVESILRGSMHSIKKDDWEKDLWEKDLIEDLRKFKAIMKNRKRPTKFIEEL